MRIARTIKSASKIFNYQKKNNKKPSIKKTKDDFSNAPLEVKQAGRANGSGSQ